MLAYMKGRGRVVSRGEGRGRPMYVNIFAKAFKAAIDATGIIAASRLVKVNVLHDICKKGSNPPGKAVRLKDAVI